MPSAKSNPQVFLRDLLLLLRLSLVLPADDNPELCGPGR